MNEDPDPLDVPAAEGHYVRDEHGNARTGVTLREWVEFMGNVELHVVLQSPVPGGSLSTVFLGLDHNFLGEGPPILWESAVIGDDGGIAVIGRHCSEAEAAAWHRATVARMQRGCSP